MVKCPNCKTKLEKTPQYCPECGTFVMDKMNNLWYLVAILMPLFGLIGGFYYVTKHKIWAWNLVGISIIAWILWWAIKYLATGTI